MRDSLSLYVDMAGEGPKPQRGGNNTAQGER
jgi:hypothetical protein